MVSAEEASNINNFSSILEVLNEKVQNRAKRGDNVTCIYRVRSKYPDSEIENAVEELEGLGYDVTIDPEAGIGPDVLTIRW